MLRQIARLRPIIAAIGVGALNQLVSSGTNFAYGLYLVRELKPEEFGLYGIAFACILFFGGLCGSLFSLQVALRSPRSQGDGAVSFQANVLAILVLFCVLAISITAIAHAFAAIFVSAWALYVELVWTTLAASLAYAGKEYFVRVAYVRFREVEALEINLTLLATLPLWLWALSRALGEPLTVESAVGSYALAHASALIRVASKAIPRALAADTRKNIGATLRDILPGGLWASLSFVAYFLRVQAHTVIVATISGPAGIAALNAARIYVTPALLLTPAMSQVTIARMAVDSRNGAASAVHGSLAACALLLAIAIAYGVVLWLSYEVAAPLVTSGFYPHISNLVALWVVYSCTLAIRNSAEMGVQVSGRQRVLAFFNLVTMIATIGAVWLLSVILQLEGAILGLIGGETLLSILLWTVLFRANKSQ